MGTYAWPAKDPDEVLDYTHDWALRIGVGDVIISCVAVADTDNSGVVVDRSDLDGAIQTVWLSGGTAGRRADVSLRATTAAGRVHEEGIQLRVKEHGS